MSATDGDNASRRPPEPTFPAAEGGASASEGCGGEFDSTSREEATSGPGRGQGRWRVLVVGEALAAALEPRLAQCAPGATVTVVPSFLFAMGEVTRHAVDAVISPADELAGMAESASRCLRELLPESRLVVVAGAEDATEAEAAVHGGFDARVDVSMSDADLAAALAVELPSPQQDRPSEPMTGVVPESPELPVLDAPLEEADLEALAVGAAPVNPPDAAAPAAPVTAPAGAADAGLGDIDMIEALLGASDRLDELALQLVAERSGIDAIGWARQAEEVPADHTPVRVAYRGQVFGVLHAPATVPVHALAGWAGWLGCWFALRQRLRQLETLSMKDEMTGVWNRRYFNRFLQHILAQSQAQRSQVTLLVFDIDDFKCYNDRYGHAAGDEILRETARLMQSFVREHDVVARIGGDEFAVIFWDAEQKRRPDSAHPQSVRQAAERFQKAICAHRFPKLLNEAPGTLTISGGLASYPWDGRAPDELLERADAMALHSKRQGKNVITFGPGAQRHGATGSPPPSQGPNPPNPPDAP